MSPKPKSIPVISLEVARRDFLSRHLLTTDPATSCTPARTLKLIRDLGFVQLDTITAVERAHHHILWARNHNYQPRFLDTLQRRGDVFEHFTHDASLIPIEHFPHWKHRFERIVWSKWIKSRLGPDGAAVLDLVRSRIQAEGPLMASDFDDPTARRGTWWEWKPAKAALELLWRSGELTVPRRVNFQKVYDFTARIHPEPHAAEVPDLVDHIDWACSTAISRLGIASPTEIARFWNAVSIAQAREWCTRAASEGRLVAANVMCFDSIARPAFALPHMASKRRIAPPPDFTRILSPFDPIIRDRARCARLFGFDYRFEAFTPAAKRKYGYFVLPVLRGEHLIARIDPDLDRSSGTFRVRNTWFEPGRGNRADRQALTKAIETYAKFNNAKVCR
ncbi:MAG: winged helix DNA-binding domain-containing protein [Planctomycetes bacterium]|nr:winged helix DNA-binding domain-containing protein [Planctomycetota bacterium]